MKKYQYQIIRYTHSQFAGEFVNLGVVVYSKEERFLKSEVTDKYGRLTKFFPGADGKFVVRILNNIQTEITRTSEKLDEYFTPDSIGEITGRILPEDDSALRFTAPRSAIEIDLDLALSDLYNNYIGRYLEIKADSSLNDEDVWRKKYKQYFDEFGITSKLTKHAVETRNDTFRFDKAWKNEIWHVYQPLSFDLQSSDAIKSKVYKWVGMINELESAEEEISITLLSALSENFNVLKDFIENRLAYASDNLKVKVVLDGDAADLARQISEDIKGHEQLH